MILDLKRWYFTYGNSFNQAFLGGWTEVWAADELTARNGYAKKHPANEDGFAPYAFCYGEEEWSQTEMFREGSNLGSGCHDRIVMAGNKVVEHTIFG